MQKFQSYARQNGTAEPAASAIVTVYYAGTTVAASIFSDNLVPPTVRANPFTADADGYFYFYAPDGRYDVYLSGGDITTPYTWGDIALLGGAEDASISSVANALALETTLYQNIIPANVITPNKKRITITSRGTFAANANQKRLRMYFGATTIYDSTLAVNGGYWEVKGEVTRVTPTGQLSYARGMFQETTGLFPLTTTLQRTTPAETLSNPVTVKTTGQATANSDIVHDSSYTEEEN